MQITELVRECETKSKQYAEAAAALVVLKNGRPRRERPVHDLPYKPHWTQLPKNRSRVEKQLRRMRRARRAG